MVVASDRHRALKIGCILLILGCGCNPMSLAIGQDRPFETGIAITPKNFPAHTAQDLDDAFRIAGDLGKYAVFIFQWHDLRLDIAKLLVEKSRQWKLTPIIGLSPTTLDQDRKELDLPEKVRISAGAMISFANPVIRQEFISAAKGLARLKPAYLCLATEINLLALQRLEEYLHFVTLYKEAYREVKRISPSTKVFVSFQWEWVRIVDAKEMNRIAEHSKVIKVFQPELDIVGLTTYPSPFHDNPEKLPNDYYSWVYRHIDKTERILFMEVGWPTAGTGDENEQMAFVKRLPHLLEGVHTSIVAWALLHDVGLGEFDANLNTVGLLTKDGRKKKAYEAFRRLKSG